jgi:hypothetical protein
LLSPPNLLKWMDDRPGATSFHEDPEDCFEEPSVSIQFSLRIAISSTHSTEQ